MSKIFTLCDGNYRTLLALAGKPWLVDCWSMRCEECRFNSPTFAQLFELRGGEFDFAKLNVEENPYVVAYIGVRILPAIVRFDPATARAVFAYGNPTLEALRVRLDV